ncbi:MAG: type II toxin-antitoxin system RelE/ParE family toxin [Thermoleophilia bacterium]
MSRKRRVTFAESAVQDLEGIRDWYASRLAADVGDRLVRDVIRRVEQLAEFPESGRIVPEFEVSWLRELIRPPFRIVYRVDDEQVRVVRVWRSERLPDGPLVGNV